MKKRLLKWFIVIDTLVLVLVVGGYFLITSEFFIKSVVLPRVSDAIGAPVSVKTCDASPLRSELSFSGLTLGNSKKPFLTVDQFDCAYGLWDMVSGVISVDRLHASKAVVYLVRDADGTWILPFKTAASKKNSKVAKPTSSSSESSQPVTLNLSNIKLEDLDVFVEIHKNADAAPTKMAFTRFSINLPSLKTGESASVSINGDLNVDAGAMVNMKSGKISLTAKSLLPSNLRPSNLELDCLLSQLVGSIQGFDLAKNQFNLKINAAEQDGTYHVKTFELKQMVDHQGGTFIGAEGTITPSPLKTDVKLKVSPLTPEVINFAAGLFGDFQFGRTMVEFDGEFQYDAETSLNATGVIAVSDFTVQSATRRLPAVAPSNIKLNYAFSFDPAKRMAKIDKLDGTVTSKARTLINLDLTDPARLAFGEKGVAFKGATPKLKLTVDKLPLGDYAPLIPIIGGFELVDGVLSADVKGRIDSTGTTFTLTSDVNASGLTTRLGDATLQNAVIQHTSSVQLENLRTLTLEKLRTTVNFNEEKAFDLLLTGAYDLSDQKGSVKGEASVIGTTMTKSLPQSWLNIPGVGTTLDAISPGSAKLTLTANCDLKSKKGGLSEFELKIARRDAGSLTLALAKPLSTSWENGLETLRSESIETTLVADALGLDAVNAFLPKNSSFKFLAGRLDAKLDVTVEKLSRLLKIKGNLNGLEAKFTAGGKTYGALSMKNDLDLTLSNYLSLGARRWKTVMETGGERALALNLNGDVAFSPLKGNVSLAVDHLDQQAFRLAAMDSPVKTMAATGSFNAALNGSSDIKLTGDVVLRDIRLKPATETSLNDLDGKPETVFEGTASLDVKRRLGGVDIGQFVCDVSGNEAKLVNLSIVGDVALPMSSGRTKLEIKSNGVDVKALQDMTAKKTVPGEDDSEIGDEKKESKPYPPKEPAANNMGGMKLLAVLDLTNITYGEHVAAECDGKVAIDQGKITVSPMTIAVNGSPVNLDGFMDMSVADGYPYSIDCSLTDFSLKGILKQFAKTKNDSEFQGEISSLGINLEGKGFTPRNVNEHLKGTAKAEFANLSTPLQSLDNQFIQVMFLPLRVLANIQNLIPNLSMSKDLAKARDISKAILDNTRNIQFDKGVLAATIDRGKLDLSKCDFTGNPIRELSLRGDMDVASPNAINFKSKLSASGVIIPLDIRGTLKSPKPDMKTFLIDFVKANTLNILNPRNLEKIVNGLKDGGKGLTGALTDIFINGSETDGGTPPGAKEEPEQKAKQTDSTSKSKEKPAKKHKTDHFPADKLLDTIDGFFK